MQKNSDLLFGKPLQLLITNALSNLNNSKKESVLVSEISVQIFLDRPELKDCIKEFSDKVKLHKRIWHCVSKLHKANLIKVEKKSAKCIATKYYIIYTKLI